METMSCILEHSDGEFEVVHYDEILKRLESGSTIGETLKHAI